MAGGGEWEGYRDGRQLEHLLRRLGPAERRRVGRALAGRARLRMRRGPAGAAGILLEAGCTDAETAAITGQSPDMVEHYAKQVNRRRLAAAAILKWETTDDARKAKSDKRSEGRQFVQPAACQVLGNIGTASWARTTDPQIHNLVL